MLILGFPDGSDGKVSAFMAGDWGSIPALGRSPGGGNDNPLQYSCLKNSMDRRAWWATQSMGSQRADTTGRLTLSHSLLALILNGICVCMLSHVEKAMATHSSILARRIPGTEEPSGLPSMGSHRVGHN